METITLPALHIIGIATRTTNQNQQAATDIPQLWNRFITEHIEAQIPGKIEEAVYCIYTDYEGDYTQPYTTILGCRVNSLEHIPDGFTGLSITPAQYRQFTAKGKLTDGAVFAEWQKIWNTDIPRAYIADIEVYGERSGRGENAEVDIFIGVK